MNLVALIGNVANEPALRYTEAGRAVCTFRLAVSRPGGEQADFFTVVAWERQAEVCAEYLDTGRRVGIEGRLHCSTWEAEDGRRSKVEIVANRVQLLGAKPKPADEEKP
jgi:single-strand DNA-binding protein